MLFCDTLFLSILFTSLHTASAVNVGRLLAARQVSQCDTQCSEASNLVTGGNCSLTYACICTPETINAINQCIQCDEAASVTASGLDSGYVQSIETDCAEAGYPVSVNSTGSFAGSTTTPSETGLGSDGGTTARPATATGALGGSSTRTAVGGQSTATGATSGKSSAMGLTARLGAVAAAVGVVILTA